MARQGSRRRVELFVPRADYTTLSQFAKERHMSLPKLILSLIHSAARATRAASSPRQEQAIGKVRLPIFATGRRPMLDVGNDGPTVPRAAKTLPGGLFIDPDPFDGVCPADMLRDRGWH